jgi:hypothetical protein
MFGQAPEKRLHEFWQQKHSECSGQTAGVLQDRNSGLHFHYITQRTMQENSDPAILRDYGGS